MCFNVFVALYDSNAGHVRYDCGTCFQRPRNESLLRQRCILNKTQCENAISVHVKARWTPNAFCCSKRKLSNAVATHTQDIRSSVVGNTFRSRILHVQQSKKWQRCRSMVVKWTRQKRWNTQVSRSLVVGKLIKVGCIDQYIEPVLHWTASSQQN